MPDRALPHDSTSCPLCAYVPPDTYRRHWKEQEKARPWHVIPDGPNLLSRLPRQAHFVTILNYRLARDGSPAMYSGPLYGEYDAADVECTFADLRRCIELLHVEYDCPPEATRVWHSGNRGLHFTIPAVICGAEAGHPQLPRIYAAMIQQLFPPQVAPTLDRTIYSGGKGRMWRLPNRRRSDTGRYKVPFSIREVLHQPYPHLEAFTIRPRKGRFWPSEDECPPCPGLVQLYHDTVAAIAQPHPRQSPQKGKASIPGGEVGMLLSHCAFIRHSRDHAATLSEPEWYAMISNVARCTDGPEVLDTEESPRTSIEAAFPAMVEPAEEPAWPPARSKTPPLQYEPSDVLRLMDELRTALRQQDTEVLATASEEWSLHLIRQCFQTCSDLIEQLQALRGALAPHHLTKERGLLEPANGSGPGGQQRDGQQMVWARVTALEAEGLDDVQIAVRLNTDEGRRRWNRGSLRALRRVHTLEDRFPVLSDGVPMRASSGDGGGTLARPAMREQ